MSLYDIAYVTWPVLLALLVAVPFTLLLANRRAWRDGYDTCADQLNERDHRAECAYCDPQPGDSVMSEATEQLMKHYVSPVDPPGSHY